MEGGTRRRSTRNCGFSGSVRESSTVKFDNRKGRVNDFNGEDGGKDAGFRVYGKVRKNQNVGVAEKRAGRSQSAAGVEKCLIQQRKVRSNSLNLSVSDDNSKEFGICKEKIVVSRSKSSNVSGFGDGLIDQKPVKLIVEEEEGKNGEKEEPEEEEKPEEKEEEEEEEEEEEKPEEKEKEEEEEEEGEEEEDYEDEEVKSIDVVEVKLSDVEKIETIAGSMELQIHEIPVSETVEEQPQIAKIHPVPPTIEQYLKYAISTPDSFDSSLQNKNRMQNLVDMVMWRDISKSAFVFGLGTFFLLSSSFTQDLNFSLVSAISHMGLLYLAIIFFYRSILCRGVIDSNEKNFNYIVGEEEAIWLIKLVLPYLNEILSKLRELFSGDPATTMKLSIILFVLARCASSITLWTMAKLAFFGVFTIPKVCSSYSVQLSGFVKFWVRRFKDAWNSCSHKKAVAFAVFTVIWNLSSIMARIWAVFFLVVVVRFYQQSLREDEWADQPSELDAKHIEDQDNKNNNNNQNKIHIKRSGPMLRRGGPILKEIT